MISSDWNSDNAYLSCTNLRVYISFTNFGPFRKFKYTQNFLLNDIRENKYTLNMHKTHISRNARKNMPKFS